MSRCGAIRSINSQCRRCLHLSRSIQSHSQSFSTSSSNQSSSELASKKSVYEVDKSSPFAFLGRAPLHAPKAKLRKPMRPVIHQSTSQSNAVDNSPNADHSNSSDLNQSQSRPSQSINPPDFEMEMLLNPCLQEDVKLEGISVVGVGDWCFDVRQVSAIPYARMVEGVVNQGETITMALLNDANDSQSTNRSTQSSHKQSSPQSNQSIISNPSVVQSNDPSIDPTRAPTIIERSQSFDPSIEREQDAGLEPGVIEMRGSIIATPTLSLMWSPGSAEEITRESLTFLELLWPRPELVLFGTGTKVEHLDEDVVDYLYELNLPFEIFESGDAAGTFNIMVEEQRRAVACLIAVSMDERLEARVPAKEKIAGMMPSRNLRAEIDRKLAENK